MTIGSAQPSRLSRTFDRARLVIWADGFAAALAASLPWSTSATSILAALWIVAFLPTLDRRMLWRALCSPAGALPVLLVLLLAIGMTWAFDASVAERLDGFKGLAKLLVIPLLMAHYQVSERGSWVLKGFLISCGVLLVISWVLYVFPEISWGFSSKKGYWPGVPVKDTIAQANEFSVCAFLIAPLIFLAYRQRRLALTIALVSTAVILIVNVLSVAVSRTALVVIPLLMLLFVLKHFSRRQSAVVLLAAAFAALAAFFLVRPVHDNVTRILAEVRQFKPEGERTRAGERLEFWRKSVEFVAQAPLLGNGTGSTRELFRRASEGQSGMAGLVSANPHNQTLAIAVQLGGIGVALLWAMWFAHLRTFWRDGYVGWAGLVVVTQNIVSSLFNSHLLDFTQGWGYVLGVGVAAGMVLKQQQGSAAGPPASQNSGAPN